jgi:DNA-binding transcriptional MerR regulator
MTRKMRREHPEYYSTSEAVELIGRSRTTLIRWRKNGILVPAHRQRMGTTDVYLYSEQDIERGKDLASRKVG